MSKSLQRKIDDVFIHCSTKSDSPPGTCDYRGITVIFWPLLDNSFSLVDVSGVYAIATGSSNTLNESTFNDFFNGIARLCFTSGIDYKERMVDLIEKSKPLVSNSGHIGLFYRCMDKSVMRILLKYDLQIRRCFSLFAGKHVTKGGNITWEEVKKSSIGMDVDSVTSFSSYYSLIPGYLTTNQVESTTKTLLKNYPVNKSMNALNSTILYPQFQLLLCFLAVEKTEAINKKSSKKNTQFAKKRNAGILLSTTINALPASATMTSNSSTVGNAGEVNEKSISEQLVDLLKSMGIDKVISDRVSNNNTYVDNEQDVINYLNGMNNTLNNSGSSSSSGGDSAFRGGVKIPASDQPVDNYTSSAGNHGRQAMLLRMEHLFDEIETKLLGTINPDSDTMQLLSIPPEEVLETRSRLTSKPVVIGDAIPVPNSCPEIIEQLLQAALAHHNLGSFTESLKFLEASRLQLIEIQRRIIRSKQNQLKNSLTSTDAGDNGTATNNSNNYSGQGVKDGIAALTVQASQLAVDETMTLPDIPLDLDLYILMCKGNVYQSCGDDEQSLIQYMEGWYKAINCSDKDWEIVCLNSIGILAYYSIRYDVALMCFATVAEYRSVAYSNKSADTATAWNNEACCLFNMNKRRDARIKFEKSWSVLCETLGHRSPRAITVWKNLEKSKRGQINYGGGHKDLSDTIALRPDADRLLLGGSFIVKALAPIETLKKSKKSGGGKKKKK